MVDFGPGCLKSGKTVKKIQNDFAQKFTLSYGKVLYCEKINN